MEHHLSIDLETYSSVPIAKAGAQRYIASDDFGILLFAFSLDGQPVQVIDAASGELPPDWLAQALFDPMYVKHAYNAAFEFGCLSKVFGPMRPEQWRCTMVHGLYCGYPAGLDAIGKALGLQEDKQKLSTGKALIRYFCVPCKPTRANGGRTRNLPRHDPEKWALFKEYCRQDVVTEMEVGRQLAGTPLPDAVQRQWETDLRINMRGVAVDLPFVNGALAMGAQAVSGLLAEAEQITGLANPNSVSQLKGWLNQEIGTEEEPEIESLSKVIVKKLLAREDNDPAVQRMLEIRQELGKTSTKKYNAIEACVCPDGRVRGLIQFYGANRTGRWAGRLVQVQNLPRTYTAATGLARDLVKAGDADAVRCLFGPVPDVLSQLIRTAFVASPGNVLIDADFSAIEARVISWLAGEGWRLEVFRTHGKIYEASASQMFGVPMELIKKGNPEYALRAKGKVAELALGYQGGPGALKAMGALDMGLKEDELQEIVTKWRNANPRITRLWYDMDEAARQVIKEGGRVQLGGRLALSTGRDAEDRRRLMVTLPSGRTLYYTEPRIGTNRFGSETVIYRGVDQTSKKWKEIETYGGKLVENCVQAIARDCLAEAIERLEAAGFPIVFHIHDEVVIDMRPYADDGTMLSQVCRIMREVPAWAQGLPLDAAGWVGPFFTKD